MNEVGSGASDWVKAHAALSELARRRAEHDWEEGGLLLQALRTEAHRHLGFGGFAEYVERLFGYGPRATEDKLRVARALENLPATDRALRDGELSWSAARELTRVAEARTEGEWLSAARWTTTLSCSCSRERSCRDQATTVVRVTRSRSRPATGASKDSSKPAGELIALEPDVVAAAECDAQHLGNVDSLEIAHVGPAPGCRHSTFVDVHHLDLRSEGGEHDPDNLVVLCAAHHLAAHRGQLIVDGTVSNGLRFRHADGRSYGSTPSASDSDVAQKAFMGLRGLGFSERDSRRALEEARVRTGVRSVEQVLRAAIELLTTH
jgi:hypothetical protein